MDWKSSSTTVRGAPSLATPFTSSITALSRTPPGVFRRCSAPRPRPPRTRSTADATQVQNRRGSLSLTSSVTQATSPELLGVPRTGSHRLPVSRWGRDESERHVLSLESLLDAWAREHVGPQPGREQLRLGEWKRLVFGAGSHGCDYGSSG